MFNKIIVTGATSMIGASLIEKLLHDDEVKKIYAVVRPASQKILRLPQNDKIKLIECDMSDYSNLANKIGNDCNVFYHLAWSRTETYQETLQDIFTKLSCVKATLLAFDTAKKLGCHNFVGAGTQAEYGISGKKLNPETPCNPIRADGILHLATCKLLMSLVTPYCTSQQNELGINCNWIRVFSVYGKYDRSNSMIMSTIKR